MRDLNIWARSTAISVSYGILPTFNKARSHVYVLVRAVFMKSVIEKNMHISY